MNVNCICVFELIKQLSRLFYVINVARKKSDHSRNLTVLTIVQIKFLRHKKQ